jgi:hypothetical protein
LVLAYRSSKTTRRTISEKDFWYVYTHVHVQSQGTHMSMCMWCVYACSYSLECKAAFVMVAIVYNLFGDSIKLQKGWRGRIKDWGVRKHMCPSVWVSVMYVLFRHMLCSLLHLSKHSQCSPARTGLITKVVTFAFSVRISSCGASAQCLRS